MSSKRWSSLFLVFLFVCSIVSIAQRKKSKINVSEGQDISHVAPKPVQKVEPKDPLRKKWIDSVYYQLTLEEKIGQLFMVAAYSGGKNYNDSLISNLVNNHQIGGLIFMQGDPVNQALLTNKYQSSAQVPLLIGMDAEWGLGMRLTGVKDFPRAMLLGATNDSFLVYKMGMCVAAQAKRLGVHIDFAPVVDINNNPNNPIINARSFGENKKHVTRLGLAYMHGLQDNGVLACAKHFPGHGDTEADSHKDLPVINKTMQQLDTLELYPFKKLIHEGIKCVMVAHLNVPAIDSGALTPTTLSHKNINELLKNNLGFNGLVFTDALDMKGVAKYFESGEVDLKAFQAGNDVLLFSQNVPVAINKIKTAIDSGIINTSDLELSVKKILGTKYDVRLHMFKPIDTSNIVNDINSNVLAIRHEAFQKGITLVKDNKKLLNKLSIADAKVGYIGINTSQNTILLDRLSNEIKNIRFDFQPKGATAKTASRIVEGMNQNDVNIIAIHGMTFYPLSSGNYGLDDEQINLLKQLDTLPNSLFVLMGNPYLTKHFQHTSSLLVAYEDDSIGQVIISDILLKKRWAKGKLPVTPAMERTVEVEEQESPIDVVNSKSSKTLQHVFFKEDGGVLNKESLKKLDQFIQKCIVDGAFPGCRILAAKNGNVFYDESFGYLDYTKQKPVDANTIYDLASMTKILSTNLAVMKLYGQGKIKLNNTLGDFLPQTKGTNKEKITIKELLLHEAGLKSWIPFYKDIIDENGAPKSTFFKKKKDKNFNIPVAQNLFLRKDYADSIWKKIIESPIETKGKFVYSDLDFYFLAVVVEQIVGKPINQYVEEQFYKPMKLKTIGYLPLKKNSLSDIAPTEQERQFRQQTIRGFVHDPGAALLGGVAGHAGLFSNAEDVAVLFQMLLNEGNFNGKKYLKPETVKLFTHYNSSTSRRGLGFDKPAAEKNDGGPASDHCSGWTFGHQGFTGTCGWADPANGITFIFLSNRVFPSAENSNINRMSVRTTAQDFIYESLGIKINKSRAALHQKQTE